MDGSENNWLFSPRQWFSLKWGRRKAAGRVHEGSAAGCHLLDGSTEQRRPLGWWRLLRLEPDDPRAGSALLEAEI